MEDSMPCLSCMPRSAFTTSWSPLAGNDLTVFRVVGDEIQLVAPVEGNFFVSDCYIVCKRKFGMRGRTWDMHMWIGADTTQDKMFIAAKKMVDLSQPLRGKTKHHRQVQGEESAAFLGYFADTGIQYLAGGSDVYFHHVDITERKRLLMIKGVKLLRVKQVPLEFSSLNTDDVFILDACSSDRGEKIFFWHGASANQHEITKGIDVMRKLRDCDYMGRPLLVRVDEDPHNEEFWEFFGGEQEITNRGSLDDYEDTYNADVTRLLRIEGEGDYSKLEHVRLADGKLRREMLRGDCVYIIDVGHCIFVWVGHHVTKGMRRESMEHVNRYVFYADRIGTNVVRVVQYAENVFFKQQFQNWDPPIQFDFTWAGSTGIAESLSIEIDLEALTRPRQKPVPTLPLTGHTTVWRVEQFQLVRVPETLFGHFFAGDSYVVLYEFEEEGNFKCVVYHWHGRETTSDESASACMHATNMSKGKGQNVLVLRVVQGKEPVNFTALFRGHMIVHFGGITSGYLNRKDQSHERGEDHLFRLKGTNEWDMRTFEVPLNEGSLCSSDCFVLVTPYDVTIWRGSASNEGQQQMVQDIARDLLPLDEVSDRSLLILDEGNETHDFWASLGERGNVPAAEETSHAHEPRMYQCTDVTGVFNVEELECAGQEDLDENRVMIVDCGHAVYVWMGSMASEVLQENSLSLARQIVVVDGARSVKTRIERVEAGAEPVAFKQQFTGWDADLRKRLSSVHPPIDPLHNREPVFVLGVVRDSSESAVHAA